MGFTGSESGSGGKNPLREGTRRSLSVLVPVMKRI